MTERTDEVRTILVKSASRPGVRHTVTIIDGRPVSCSCEAFVYRSRCPHIGTSYGSSRSRPRSGGYVPSHRAPSRWDVTKAYGRAWRDHPILAARATYYIAKGHVERWMDKHL